MIERAWAELFAEDWIRVWNARDLDAILAHYADDIEFSSPRIALVMGTKDARVKGKSALRAYWQKALGLNPALRFTLDRVLTGSDAVTIAYRNQRGEHVTETFAFDDAGLVKQSFATYAPQ